MSDARFLHALNYCMLLPGPEAQQLATYIGWLMHRTAGGVMAGGLFVLPGIFAIMALSYVYAAYGDLPLVNALFFGLKAAVLAIVVDAVFRVGKRALKNNVLRASRRPPSSASIFRRAVPVHRDRGGTGGLCRCAGGFGRVQRRQFARRRHGGGRPGRQPARRGGSRPCAAECGAGRCGSPPSGWCCGWRRSPRSS